MVRVNRSASLLGSNDNLERSGVYTASEARRIATKWVSSWLQDGNLSFGLPEVDDRYGAWRVTMLDVPLGKPVGELMISCKDGTVLQASDPAVILRRLGSTDGNHSEFKLSLYEQSVTPKGDRICLGDARVILKALPEVTTQLVITSPPYFNAKLEYSEYADYDEYLKLLEEVCAQCHRVLSEGRFMVVNASPVLVRRPSRNRSSTRIPVPFHINTLMEKLGFDFVDDIVWVKPTGAGWNTGRGRRFAADRHPLQYKPVPVTEYFLVYRKHTEKLIDWNLRTHPDQDVVGASRIEDGYEVTNVWYEKPANHPVHPAIFPENIIRKLIRYYSFVGDIVMDPFAGIGTVGHAALAEKRGFFLIDSNESYYKIMRQKLLG